MVESSASDVNSGQHSMDGAEQDLPTRLQRGRANRGASTASGPSPLFHTTPRHTHIISHSINTAVMMDHSKMDHSHMGHGDMGHGDMDMPMCSMNARLP